MPIIMALWVLLGFGVNTPLTNEEIITKQCGINGRNIERHMNSVGQGENWLHSQPSTMSSDRNIERHA
jgi:hypothetical protein